jgi:uncharacterized protein (DUF58 family)
MSFGTARAEKRDVAVALAAAFLHLGSGPGDRVRAAVAGAGPVRVPPARGGRDGAMTALRDVLRHPRTDTGGGDLGAALQALAGQRLRRGLLVVVSDLLDDPSTWARPLRVLALRTDVVVAQVVDRRELALPAAGTLRLVDPETGRQVEVATSARTRARYAEAAALRLDAARSAVRGAGASHLLVRTERDWLPQLAQFLLTRRRTRRALAPTGGR